MRFSFSGFESRALIIALIGLLGFGYWLTRDDLFTENTQKGEAIGRFTNVVHNVKSRTSDSFVWDTAFDSLPIYQRQNIFTGPDSEAEIEMASGSKIFVKPNSLIRLVTKNGGLQLELKYGNLESEIAASENLIISDGDSKTQIKSEEKTSRVSLVRKKQESAKVRSLAGKVKLQTGKTEIKLDSPKEEARIKTGKVELPTLQVNLKAITSPNQSFLRFKKEDPIYLQWLSSNSRVPNRVIISQDESFKIIKKVEVVRADRMTLGAEIPDGQYFWKVEAQDENQKVIASLPGQNFRLSTVEPPAIKSPAADSEVKFGSDTEFSSVPFEISKNNYLKTVHLEIATDLEFKNILDAQTIPLQTGLSKPLRSGNYYARVAGIGESSQQTHWSMPTRFKLTVVTKAKVPKSAPILITKELLHKMSERSPASVQPIKWKTDDSNLTSFMLEISRDKDFRKKSTLETKEKSGTFKPLIPGQYYFRVAGKNKDGLQSPFSEVGVYTIEGYDLELTGPKSISVVSETSPVPPEKNFSFKWSQAPNAAQYILEIGQDKEFNKIKSHPINGDKIELTLNEPGTYFARVQGLTVKKEVATAYSNVINFQYNFTTNLKPPLLLEPQNKSSMFLQSTKEPRIWLTWKEIPKIRMYTVQISDTPDFAKILYNIPSESNRLLLTQTLGQGKFYWRVKAGGADLRLPASDWSPPFEFAVKQHSNELIFK